MGNYLHLHGTCNGSNGKAQLINYIFPQLLFSSRICFQSIIHSSTYLERYHTATFICVAYVQIYLLCYFCNIVTTAQESIGDEIPRSNWYLLPVKLQKMLPFSIIYAQNPVYVEAFGSIACTRETFKKVWLVQFIQSLAIFFITLISSSCSTRHFLILWYCDSLSSNIWIKAEFNLILRINWMFNLAEDCFPLLDNIQWI